MIDEVTVKFGADVAELEQGIANVQGALGVLAPQIKSVADGLAEAAQKSDPLSGHFKNAADSVSGDLTNALKLAKTEIAGKIQAQQDALALKKTIYDGEVSLKNITEEEKLELVKKATQEEYEAQHALLQKEAELSGQSLAQKEAAQNRVIHLEATHQRQLQQFANESAQQQAQIWQDLSSRIGQSMSSSIMGLLQHTTTFREAARQIALQITQYFVKSGADWVSEYAMTIARNIATHVMGEQTMTAATQAGVAERSASVAAGSIADLASKAAAVLKSIIASSAEAFAGVFGFMAPLLGPAAAGPAAAAQATVAGMASVASFDIGAWSIPEDQLAMVHKNELVMTASQGEAFRNVLDNAGGSGRGSDLQVHAPVNFHIHAVDSENVARFFQSNGKEIMRAMAKHVQDGAHLGLRGLNPA
ncbi:hypothetical protein [Methylocystis heyeri]|uniref:Uncharacterized protein n=1 Tax=Methylocystis heyeri TaxID=391905 RepID=A0A6B8KDT0_9HYPH|nr:hypothetical protein [Methylocystis heyeri]QGM45837.1 hypothetical protein H2LOC_009055 [Methylocystis heyeri]